MEFIGKDGGQNDRATVSLHGEGSDILITTAFEIIIRGNGIARYWLREEA